MIELFKFKPKKRFLKITGLKKNLVKHKMPTVEYPVGTQESYRQRIYRFLVVALAAYLSIQGIPAIQIQSLQIPEIPSFLPKPFVLPENNFQRSSSCTNLETRTFSSNQCSPNLRDFQILEEITEQQVQDLIQLQDTKIVNKEYIDKKIEEMKQRIKKEAEEPYYHFLNDHFQIFPGSRAFSEWLQSCESK